MHILLTRPLDDSKELILKFTSMKHKVSHLPLLQIKKIETQEIDFSQFKGVIFTSANSLKNLNISKIDKKIICFCVGIATERKAAPTIIKLIMQEVFTAPIKLAIKLLKFRDFEDQASISAPITPMVAASVGVA